MHLAIVEAQAIGVGLQYTKVFRSWILVYSAFRGNNNPFLGYQCSNPVL